MVTLNESDHRVMAELLSERHAYNQVEQLEGMLTALHRVERYILDEIISIAKKAKS
jgi:hypothetical protein